MEQPDLSKTMVGEIVTPEGVIHSCQASMIIVPGEHGQFGVLPHHSPIIAMMQPGIATFYEHTVSTTYFIFDGFAEITTDRCVLLAEKAIPIEKVTSELVDEKHRNIQEMITSLGYTKESPEVKKELRIADAMSHVIE